MFKISQEIKCPGCGSKLYPTLKSRQKSGFFTFLPLVIYFFTNNWSFIQAYVFDIFAAIKYNNDLAAICICIYR
jgi:CXXC-20-CXXC protein